MNATDYYDMLLRFKMERNTLASRTDARASVAMDVKIVLRHLRPLAASGESIDDAIRILESTYQLTQTNTQ
jgi:hypothetical protein